MSNKDKLIIDRQKITIADLNAKLVKCEEARSHFISNIRNEIINPFASIQGLGKIIVKSKKEEWEKVISIASMIHKEAFALDFQLMNVFSAAELESGETKIDYNNANISDLFVSEIDNYIVLLEKKNIQIDLFQNNDTEKYAITDLNKIKVVFVNVLMNAINYSSEGSRIIVNYSIDDDSFMFSVQDFGVGMSNEDQKRFFNRFEKANNEINSLNIGLGLGLSVIAGYVELFDGSIEIDSELEKGSLFTITIPIPNLNKDELDIVDSENEFFFDDNIF